MRDTRIRRFASGQPFSIPLVLLVTLILGLAWVITQAQLREMGVVKSGTTTSFGNALRFYGNGESDIDRVKIPIPNKSVNVGSGDFTIEWWMKANAADNDGYATCGANDGWITANILFDRDIYGAGDYGDFGIAVANGKLVFGVSVGNSGTVLCSTRVVADSYWHHVAVSRRRSDGQLSVFIDGTLDKQGDGADGDASYRNGQSTNYPNSDPYLVIGAEKHDAGSQYPSYNGYVDDVRVSSLLRYSGNFTRPTSPHASDGSTVALYRFDEGTGTTITDSSGGGNTGERKVGGSPQGPAYVDSDIIGSANPTTAPTIVPTIKPTTFPTAKSTAYPTNKPTAYPTAKPPTSVLTAKPTPKPTYKPGTVAPTGIPTPTTGVKTPNPQPTQRTGSTANITTAPTRSVSQIGLYYPTPAPGKFDGFFNRMTASAERFGSSPASALGFGGDNIGRIMHSRPLKWLRSLYGNFRHIIGFR